MGSEQKKSGYVVRCSSCGALFDADYSYCPYCGRMNDPAAEREYMEHLEDIRQDVEDLQYIPGEEAAKVAKAQGKKIAKIVIVTLCVIGLIAGGFWLKQSLTDSGSDPKQAYLWRQVTFPMLNAFYEEEDYEAIVDTCRDARENGYDIWRWEHADFADIYADLRTIREVTANRGDSFRPEEMSDYEYQDLFYSEVRALYRYEREGSLDEDEKARLSEMAAEVREDFDNVFRLTEKQEAELWEKVEADGFVSYVTVTELAEKWRNR